MNKFYQKTFIYTISGAILSLVILNYYIWNNSKSFILTSLRDELAKKFSLALQLIDLNTFQKEDLGALKKYTDDIKKLTGLRTTLINKEGKVLADSELEPDELVGVESHLMRPEVQQALKTGSGIATRRSTTIDKNLIYYCDNLRVNQRIIGFLRFAMFSPDFNARMNYIKKILIQVNISLLILAVLAVFTYWRWLKSQLDSLRVNLAGQRESEKFDSLPTQKYEEFESIRGEINTIGEKLQKKIISLSNKNEQMMNIFNALTQGFAVFNRAGQAIVYNQNFFNILKIQQANVADKPFYDWIHFPPLIQDIENFLNNKKSIQKRIKYYQNTYIEYQISSFLNKKNEDEGFLLAIQDVTHIQQLETVRQDFVANVSHEFKTPLTSIRGYAETLLSGLEDDPEIRIKFLKKIENQTKQLENLVSDLLRLSQIEKREVSQLEEMNPVPVIQEIIEEFKQIAHNQKIKLHFELDPENKDIKIYANRKIIQTILSNLLTNAIQYNEPEGSVFVRLKQEENNLILEVKDTGIGIPPKQLDRIFERFYRVESARELVPEGSGLGLSIVKHSVDLLSGQVGVKSDMGMGSLFWIQIPLIYHQ